MVSLTDQVNKVCYSSLHWSALIELLLQMVEEQQNTNARLDSLRTEFNGLHSEFKGLNAEFKGFSGNISASTEEEVTLCVVSHLVAMGHEVVDWEFGRKCRSKGGRILCEVDGMVWTSKFIAVVEAKQRASTDALQQLAKTLNIVRKSEELPAIGFIGAPLFGQDVQEKALELGFGVVTLSGDRYRVVPTEKPELEKTG
jgi:hypothetical protein